MTQKDNKISLNPSDFIPPAKRGRKKKPIEESDPHLQKILDGIIKKPEKEK